MSFAKEYLNRLAGVIQELDCDQVDRAVSLIEDAWKRGSKVITFGNGGSAATASHYIVDWNKGISYKKDLKMKGLCLNDNVASVMAYANDVSYAAVFVEQLKNFLEKDDLVIGVSGSGNSENVIQAIDYANKNGGITLGLCGYGGGKLKQIAQHSVWINVNDMQLVEDLHLSFGHIVMQRLCGGATC